MTAVPVASLRDGIALAVVLAGCLLWVWAGRWSPRARTQRAARAAAAVATREDDASEHRLSGEQVTLAWGSLVVGVAAIGLGVFLLLRPVMCGDEVMHPGDYCQAYREGAKVGSPHSYGEEHQMPLLFAVAALVVGVAFLGQGIVIFGRRLMRRARRHHEQGRPSGLGGQIPPAAPP